MGADPEAAVNDEPAPTDDVPVSTVASADASHQIPGAEGQSDIPPSAE
jgi:hypothetical protein